MASPLLAELWENMLGSSVSGQLEDNIALIVVGTAVVRIGLLGRFQSQSQSVDCCCEGADSGAGLVALVAAAAAAAEVAFSVVEKIGVVSHCFWWVRSWYCCLETRGESRRVRCSSRRRACVAWLVRWKGGPGWRWCVGQDDTERYSERMG